MMAYPQDDFEGVITYKLRLTGTASRLSAGMMPEKYIFFVKGNLVRMQTRGGLMYQIQDVLFPGSNMGALLLMENEMIAYEINPLNAQHYVEEPDRHKNYKGIRCGVYLNSSETPTMTTKSKMYATRKYDLQFPVCQVDWVLGVFSSAAVAGWPLFIEKKTVIHSGGTMNLVIRMEKMEKKSLPDELFQLPQGYVIQPFENMIFEY